MKYLFTLILSITTLTAFTQDLPCQEKYENQRCAVRYREDTQGNIHGLYIEYTEDGTVFRKGNYDHGVKIGCWYEILQGAGNIFDILAISENTRPYKWYEKGERIATSDSEIKSLQHANQVKEAQDKASMTVDYLEDKDGNKYRREYKTDRWGQMAGIVKVYFPSGKLYNIYNEGQWEGKGCAIGKNGPFTYYYENGKVEQKGNYIRSNETGLIEEFYENGNKKSIAIYKQVGYSVDDQYLDGIQEEYYTNGSIKERINYKSGKLNGFCESYYENGNLKYKISFEDGIRSGVCEWYYPNGNLEERQVCQKLCNQKDFNNSNTYELCYLAAQRNGSNCACYKAIIEEYNENTKISSKSSAIYNFNEKTDIIEEISKEGLYEQYDQNGNLITKYNFKNNYKDGEFIKITPSTKYSGTYTFGQLTGNDTISDPSYIFRFLNKNSMTCITATMSDTILLSVNFNAGNPIGIQKIYQKGSNKLLLKVFYNDQGKLIKIERYYKTVDEEVDKDQYQNCMITLTDKCLIIPSEIPYSIGYAVNGKIQFNHLLQGPQTGKLDYPDLIPFVTKMKEIVVRNEKGEFEAYVNMLIQEVGNKEIIKIMLNDLIPLFEAEKMKHKDFKVIKSLYLN